jgi:hypothetical protein
MPAIDEQAVDGPATAAPKSTVTLLFASVDTACQLVRSRR